MKNGIKAVLFDMDGVLVDSEGYMLQAAKSALAKWGIQAKDEDFTEFVGAGEDKYVGGVAEKHGHTYITAMKDEAYRIYGELAKGQPMALESAGEMLSWLKAQGYKLAVCSSADRVKVDINISALHLPDGTLDDVVSGEDIVNKKPAPDIYLRGAALLGVKPEECMVVEDAINGIVAGHRAGMKCIGVTTSFPADVLAREAAPEHIIHSLTEMKTIL